MLGNPKQQNNPNNQSKAKKLDPKTKNILLNKNDTPAATITKTKNYEKA